MGAGFQTTTLPIRAGAVGRLPAIAVKLNGRDGVDETLERPVVGLVPDAGAGDAAARAGSAPANFTLNRQKSISSQAASISAWNAVFDCPSMVAALSVSRQGPASRSAAFRKIAARSSNDMARHAGAAFFAAATAAAASLRVAFFTCPACACARAAARP